MSVNLNNIHEFLNPFECNHSLEKTDLDTLVNTLNNTIRGLKSVNDYIATREGSGLSKWSDDIDGNDLDDYFSTYLANNGFLKTPLTQINNKGLSVPNPSNPACGTILYYINGSWGYKYLSPYINDLLGISTSPSLNSILKYDGSKWIYEDINNITGSADLTGLLDYLDKNGTKSSSFGPTSGDNVLVYSYNGSTGSWSFKSYINSSGGTPIDLSAYRWWGLPLNTNNNTITGHLEGNIDYIKFEKTISGQTKIVYLGLDDDGNLRVSSNNGTGAANFYATGGVSSLGNSPSGSGSGGGLQGVIPELNPILDFINDNDNYDYTNSYPSINIASGTLYLLKGTSNGTFDITILGDLNTSGFLKKNGNTYSWSTPDGTLPVINTGDENKYLKTDSNGDPYWASGTESGGITSIKYKTENNPTETLISNSGDPFTLIKGDNINCNVDDSNHNITLSVPLASTGTAGVVRVGSGLTMGTGIDIDELSVKLKNNGGITATAADGLYLTNNSVIVNGETIALGESGTITALWPEAKNFSIKNTSGTTISTTPSTTGNSNVAIQLSSNANLGAVNIDGNAATATQFANKRVLWGNDDWGNTNLGYTVDGVTTAGSAHHLKNVYRIYMVDEIYMRPSVDYKEYPVISLNASALHIGKGPATKTTDSTVETGKNSLTNNTVTNLYGYGINFLSKGDTTTTFQLTTAGQAYLVNSDHEYTSGLRIGTAVLYCDASGNLALKSSTGTACDFYATGGVSALGMSSGTGSVGAMTFGEVDINSKLTINGNFENKETASLLFDEDGDFCISGAPIVVDHNFYIDGNLFVIGDDNRCVYFNGADLRLNNNWRFRATETDVYLEYSSNNFNDVTIKGTWSV